MSPSSLIHASDCLADLSNRTYLWVMRITMMAMMVVMTKMSTMSITYCWFWSSLFFLLVQYSSTLFSWVSSFSKMTENEDIGQIDSLQG